MFVPLAIMTLMVVIATNYKGTSSWQGEYFNIAVISTIGSYIELGLLVCIPVIECYKKFKLTNIEPIVIKPIDESSETTVVNDTTETLSNTDEIKKFKELLDMGAITQEEFDAKKKELLGL
ncbi:MAG: SHOCT domain-containing protein [Clostridia bacterium]|nr:SHOCT domain-containing protein [Clostridia bacterium]